MNKCINCQKELTTGEVAYNGFCYNCYNKKCIENFVALNGGIEKDQEIKELKEQLAELKAELKAKDLLVDCYMSVVGTLDNAKNLQQQLKEKDEDIEMIRANHYYVFDFKDKAHQEVVLSDVMLNTIIKQVCEKIKEKLQGNFLANNSGEYIYKTALFYILDKIEKGDL